MSRIKFLVTMGTILISFSLTAQSVSFMDSEKKNEILEGWESIQPGLKLPAKPNPSLTQDELLVQVEQVREVDRFLNQDWNATFDKYCECFKSMSDPVSGFPGFKGRTLKDLVSFFQAEYKKAKPIIDLYESEFKNREMKAYMANQCAEKGFKDIKPGLKVDYTDQVVTDYYWRATVARLNEDGRLVLQMDDDTPKDKEKYELLSTCEFIDKRGTHTKSANNRKQYNEMAQSYYDANYERKKIHDPRCPGGQNWKGGRCCEYMFGQWGMCYGR